MQAVNAGKYLISCSNSFIPSQGVVNFLQVFCIFSCIKSTPRETADIPHEKRKTKTPNNKQKQGIADNFSYSTHGDTRGKKETTFEELEDCYELLDLSLSEELEEYYDALFANIFSLSEDFEDYSDSLKNLFSALERGLVAHEANSSPKSQLHKHEVASSKINCVNTTKLLMDQL